jgi:hypothetical protein
MLRADENFVIFFAEIRIDNPVKTGPSTFPISGNIKPSFNNLVYLY